MSCLYRIHSKIFDTLGGIVTDLKFLAYEGSSFLYIEVTSVSFNSFINSALTKNLFNAVFFISEQK